MNRRKPGRYIIWRLERFGLKWIGYMPRYTQRGYYAFFFKDPEGISTKSRGLSTGNNP